ncbi:hypothetical protein [Chromobacterium haemolyticum]|uniref:hypothetical protein n=1 Tax=Chromobacterium haemolyticum TaxID=394935 RepID=UPI0024480ABC|nr:hypothetical protein [Chromobacterium haemolyticum]MDH0342870.1 hypothetical protein [Chromobacterium haemolyticum]
MNDTEKSSPASPTPPNINLQLFCASPNDRRAWMCAPFQINGKTYASNGRILVETDGGDHPGAPTEKVQPILDVLDRIPAEGYQALPPITAPKLAPCRVCDGRGDRQTCQSCGGLGVFEHYGKGYACKCCDSHGHFDGPCHYCNATGQIDTSTPVQIGGAHYMRSYLYLIAQLPTPLFAPSARPDGIAGFTFQGGRGALMPLYP